MDRASSKASSFGDKLKNGLANAAKVGAAALAAATAATTALTAAMVKGVSDTAAYGDNIDKMSQKMGLSAQAYQEWDAIMQHSGTSIESLQAGMKTLANAVENGNDAFERLGISQEQIASMNNEELFSATITALQNVENETERTYLAGQLLGRGATELGALLNTSAEDTEAMRQRVHELGGVMSDEAVKAAAAYQDSLQDMQTAFSGVARGMTGEFLPSITAVMDGITNLFSGDSEKGIGQIQVGIEGFLDTLEYAVPQVLEKGKGIVDALVGGIAENLPWIADAAINVIGGLASGIADNLPVITDSAVQIVTMLAESIISVLPEIGSSAVEIITTLANGISEQLPELVPVAIDAILQLADTLTDPGNLSTIIDSGLDFITALADGLINSLPVLFEKGPEIVQNIVDAVIENAPKMLDAAAEIVNELGNALSEQIPGLSFVFENLETIVAGVTAAFIAFKAAMAISSLIETLTNVTNLQTVAQTALNAVMNANPFVLIATLIAGVVTALVTLWNTNEGFRNAVKGIWDAITNVFSAAWEAIKAAWEVAGEFFSGIWDGIKKTFSPAADVLGGFFSAAWEAIKVVWGAATGWFKNIWNTIKGIFSVAKAVLSGDFSGAWEAIKDVLAGWGDYFSGLWNTVKEIFASVKDWFFDVGKNLLEGIWNGINDKVDWLKGKVAGVVDTIKEWFTGEEGFDEHSPSKWSQGVAKFVMDGLSNGFEKGKNKVMEAAGRVVDGAKNILDKVKDAIEEKTAEKETAQAGKSFVGALADGMDAATPQLIEKADAIIKSLKSRFDELSSFIGLKSDVGDLEYQLWERTEGKNVSDIDKYTKKLELLSVKQEGQKSIVDAASAAYKKVVEQYGEGAAESYEYQKALLQEKLALQDLLDEIEEVTNAKKAMQQQMFFRQAQIDFANSGLGRASAAAINAGYITPQEVSQIANINLVTPDGKVLAEYIADPLVNHMDANGTPIVNPKW